MLSSAAGGKVQDDSHYSLETSTAFFFPFCSSSLYVPNLIKSFEFPSVFLALAPTNQPTCLPLRQAAYAIRRQPLRKYKIFSLKQTPEIWSHIYLCGWGLIGNSQVTLTAANLQALQYQLDTANKNGSSREGQRKDMCRVQKAGYSMGFSFSAVMLQTPHHVVEDWMEEHSR